MENPIPPSQEELETAYQNILKNVGGIDVIYGAPLPPITIDDDLNEPLPARTCSEGEACESCQ